MSDEQAVRSLVFELLTFTRAELRLERASRGPLSATAVVMHAVERGYSGDGCSVRSSLAVRADARDVEVPLPSPKTRARLEQLEADERATAEAIMDDEHGFTLAPLESEGRTYQLSLAARLGMALAPEKRQRAWRKKFAERDSRPAILGATELGERRLAALARAWFSLSLSDGTESEEHSTDTTTTPAAPATTATPAAPTAPVASKANSRASVAARKKPSPTAASKAPAELVATSKLEAPAELETPTVSGRVSVFDPDEGWCTEFEGRARAIALEARAPDVVRELRELSLSRVVLEGLGEAEVERIEDIARRGAAFVLVRGERRIDGGVVWLCFELDAPASACGAIVAA